MNESYTEADTPRIAQQVLALLAPQPDRATVLCLEGDLGVGKTALAKALASALGVTDTVVSPTFVIEKFYTPTQGDFDQLVHIDAYRIESVDELIPLGFSTVLKQANTLIIIEWPEHIKAALPESVTWLTLSHQEEGRHIEMK